MMRIIERNLQKKDMVLTFKLVDIQKKLQQKSSNKKMNIFEQLILVLIIYKNMPIYDITSKLNKEKIE